jgi:hypothetical protein
MTSAKLLIVVLVGLAVGAITGLALNGILGEFYLALVAGFLATVIGCVIRNTIMVRGSGAPDDARTRWSLSYFLSLHRLPAAQPLSRLRSIVMI